MPTPNPNSPPNPSDPSDPTLDLPPNPAPNSFAPSPLEPDASRLPIIEGFTLLKTLGQGGQGVVYQAQQQSPKRKVAIKILLNAPYASKSAKHRFEREIELVATLRHPHIVAVFGSGHTRDGHLYYVMDYVRGVSLTQHVHANKLPLEKTLELFAVACDAVNHAHQKGVMHRDLKPANILVDDEGNLRVLDFGLAKHIAEASDTMASITGHIMGTLQYMSPEQTKGNPDLLDIRTDVYALGVILYELLTGTYPYPVIGEMADILRHITQTAPKPLAKSWTRTEGIQSAGKKRPSNKCPINDEVQTIALKALSKERERRYQSAGELGRDIHHYLRNEPIEAKRDSGLYLLQRTLKKYRLASSVAALFILLLAVSTIVFWTLRNQAADSAVSERSSRQALQANHQALIDARDAADRNRKAAETAAARSDEVAQFMKDIFKAANPEVARGRDASILRDILDKTRARLDAGAINQPAVQAELYETLGTVYTNIAEYDSAEKALRQALQIRVDLSGGEDAATASTLQALCELLHRNGKLNECETLIRKSLAIRRRLFGDRSLPVADSLEELASVVKLLSGKVEEAEAAAREGLSIRKSLLPANDIKVAAALSTLGMVLASQRKDAEAEPFMMEALAIRRIALGDDHPDTAGLYVNLADTQQRLGKLSDAEANFRRGLQIQRHILPAGHRDIPSTLFLLGSILVKQDKLPEAEACLRESIALYSKLPPGYQPYRNNAPGLLNAILEKQHKPPEPLTTAPK